MAELRDARALAPVLVAAVGPATADALRREGVEPDLVPAEHSARALVETFPDFDGAGSPPRAVPVCRPRAGHRRGGAAGQGMGGDPRGGVPHGAAGGARARTARPGGGRRTRSRSPRRRRCRPSWRCGRPKAGAYGRPRTWCASARPPPARRAPPVSPVSTRHGGLRGRGSSPSWSATSATRETAAPRLVPMAEATSSVPEATPTAAAAAFPARRLRRLRRTPALRRLVAEARLGVDDLVAPLFVREGIDAPVPIPSMPGEVQHTVDSLVVEAKRLVSLGIPALILFGVPATQGRRGKRRLGPRRRGAGRAACRAGRGGRRARADGGPVPRRVHRPRALRRAGTRRRGPQRPDARAVPRDRPRPGRRPAPTWWRRAG